MSKEKVFIVLSHKHSLKAKSRTEWEVSETVEFVNQLRNRHISMSSAIGDYLNRKMLSGERHGMTDYNKFEEYVRGKYAKQMSELDTAYADMRVADNSVVSNMITDQFGNVREKTVFDTYE